MKTADTRRIEGLPLLGYVVALAAAIALPLFVLVAILTSHWVGSEQARIRDSARRLAKDAVEQVDRYVAGQVAMLQALATSPAIDLGDFISMDAQMRELARVNGADIVLRASDGSRRVDTRYAPGEATPNSPLTGDERAMLESNDNSLGERFVTTAEFDTATTRVSVPVIRDGELRYVIAARLPAVKLGAILRGSGVDPPYSGAVTDAAGRIIARSDGKTQAIGAAWLSLAGPVAAAGEWTGKDADGEEIHTSYHRSETSGWIVGVAVYKSYITAPLYRSLWTTGLVGLGLLALIFFMSGRIARAIVSAQREVRAAAQAVRLGETIEAPRTPVRETNLIGAALADASARLRDQAVALIAANRDLELRVANRTGVVSAQAALIRTTLDSMAQGLFLIDKDGRVEICNQRALDLLELPASFMEQKPLLSEVLRWQAAGEDFERSDAAFRSWIAAGGIEAQEHTYERERPNGIVLQVQTRPLPAGGWVRTFTDVTARKAAEREAMFLARHDPLTSLPNRTLLLERLAGELSRPAGCALLMLDLDRFKAVNDTHGHPAGDELLRQVSRRISPMVRAQDLVARLGGDEFAILQFADGRPADACRLAERIVASIRQPFHVCGQDVRIGTSIGIAIAPADGATADALLKSADLALYRAKSGGRGGYRRYEAAMDAAARERQALELDLRRALDRDEFVLHYQPVIDLSDGGVCGFEALVRWRHPTRGLLTPGDFIPIAEDARLIVSLGDWVLREACREATRWPSTTRVLINISPIQIEDPAFVASVLAAITRSGLQPRRVQLEITETVLVRESEGVLQAMRTLQDFGVKIVLDDFGAGYSSLNYLRLFPFDGLKIDRSFASSIDDARAAAIMSSIASLALGFGMSVTAEGIETREQLDFVLRNACTEGQGYFFGRPMPGLDALEAARRTHAIRAEKSDGEGPDTASPHLRLASAR